MYISLFCGLFNNFLDEMTGILSLVGKINILNNYRMEYLYQLHSDHPAVWVEYCGSFILTKKPPKSNLVTIVYSYNLTVFLII